MAITAFSGSQLAHVLVYVPSRRTLLMIVGLFVALNLGYADTPSLPEVVLCGMAIQWSSFAT
jgi:hypothetical protein